MPQFLQAGFGPRLDGICRSLWHRVLCHRHPSDSSETVSDTFLYDAWGNEIVRTGSTRIVFRFVGQYGYLYNLDTGDFYVIERI